MGLPADKSALPFLDPVGKAIGASASLLTSSLPTGVADSTTPPPPAGPAPPWRCSSQLRHRQRRWWCYLVAPLSQRACATCRGGSSLGVPLVSALNLSLAVAVVVSCKLSYDRARLPNLTLTVVHLAASLAALRTATVFRVTWSPTTPSSEGLAPKASCSTTTSVSSFEHWRLALLLCAFMALPNLSLEFNTAGTSILLRLLSLPVTAWLQTAVFGRKQRRGVVLSLLPVALGVSMNALGDLRFNPVGLVFGVAGAAAAAFYFTLASEQQRRLCLPPWQLLEAQLQRAIPALALVAVILEPPWRGPRGLLARNWHLRDAVLLVGSSLAGCLLTLTMQWLLGRTSALTYQVLGHVKMCVTLIACAIVFDENLKLMQQAGVFLTLCGAVLYTAFKSRDQPAPSTSLPYPLHHHHGNETPIGSSSASAK
ncbi:solute carrier family 35 member E3-like [Rhipicephalus microplus]|uniref:solute carrier family 35 member E3-like n=1 Tax=Rhipicephalus microplus TaxID=6941 RepID=UPI003F6B662B